jgi:IS5 family transposase
MYIAQQCFGLSDEAIEDAIDDSQAIRLFVGVDLARDTTPDAATLLKFQAASSLERIASFRF